MAKKKPSSSPKYTVGVDLGGTKMLAVVYDEKNKLVAKKKASSQSLDAGTGTEKIIGTVRSALKNANLKDSDIDGIGMACPGLVDPSAGVLRNAPNLGWENLPLAAKLKKEFGCPVVLINDVDAGTFGEYHAGAGQGAHSVAGIFPGTGVGAGFVYEGRLLTGKKTSCMEIGLVYVPGTDLHSPHEGLVMLEDMCGRLAIAAAANTACYRGQAPKLVKNADFDLRQIKSKALSESLEAGEEAIVKILHNAADALSLGLAAMINLLAPEKIVLGGGLVEDMPKIFFDRVVKRTRKLAQAPLVKTTSFHVAKLGAEAVAMGAALYLRDRLANAKSKK